MIADGVASIVQWLHLIFVQQFDLWVLFGLIAQAMFTARFLVQWIASERARRSIVPPVFWFFSAAGGGLLLIYAIYREDPVFIVGQAAGLFIYLRNIMLIRREKRAAGAS